MFLFCHFILFELIGQHEKSSDVHPPICPANVMIIYIYNIIIFYIYKRTVLMIVDDD